MEEVEDVACLERQLVDALWRAIRAGPHQWTFREVGCRGRYDSHFTRRQRSRALCVVDAVNKSAIRATERMAEQAASALKVKVNDVSESTDELRTFVLEVCMNYQISVFQKVVGCRWFNSTNAQASVLRCYKVSRKSVGREISCFLYSNAI